MNVAETIFNALKKAGVVQGFYGIPSPSAVPRVTLVADDGALAQEAKAFILGFVPLEFQPAVTIPIKVRFKDVIHTTYRGYGLGEIPAGHDQGMFFTPDASKGRGAEIYLAAEQNLPWDKRQYLSLHEFGHGVWFYLTSYEMWVRWGIGEPERFADRFVDFVLGRKMNDRDYGFFNDLRNQLRANPKLQRG